MKLQQLLSYTRKAVDAKRMALKELCVYKEVPRWESPAERIP